MDSFGDDKIARLLRLKRYEQPPPGYFENFLDEFRRRQRDESLRDPLWSICVDRVRDFMLRHNVSPLAWYSAGMAALVGCAAVISITLYQQPDTPQLAVERSPVPIPPPITEKELDLAPPVFPATFDMRPTLLPAGINVPGRSPTDFTRMNSSRSSLSGNLSQICHCRTNNRGANTSIVTSVACALYGSLRESGVSLSFAANRSPNALSE
jgi:hypothetical protein